MAAVAAHPVPLNTVRRRCGIEALPQIDVLHRLAVGRLPLAAFPVDEPFGDALPHVLRVGGEDLGAGLGLLLAFIPNDHAPPAGTGIAAASAVRKHLHALSHGRRGRWWACPPLPPARASAASGS